MSMFCYQCELTAGCKGCTGKLSVCGKKEDTAVLQDQLIGTLAGLAHPACLSVPNVVDFLEKTFGIAPITTPEADFREILG